MAGEALNPGVSFVVKSSVVLKTGLDIVDPHVTQLQTPTRFYVPSIEIHSISYGDCSGVESGGWVCLSVGGVDWWVVSQVLSAVVTLYPGPVALSGCGKGKSKYEEHFTEHAQLHNGQLQLQQAIFFHFQLARCVFVQV